MNCMKCGRETEENQIFCKECLALMDRYPVKPGTVVQIPTQPAKKQVHHRRVTVTPEERVRRLVRWNFLLSGFLLLTMAAALLFAMMAFNLVEDTGVKKLLGQNYSVVQQTDPPPQTVYPSPLH